MVNTKHVTKHFLFNILVPFDLDFWFENLEQKGRNRT